MTRRTTRGAPAFGLPVAPKISLGQNFLRDADLLDELVLLSGIGAQDTVFEIGAGLGDLTLALARRCHRVLAMEIDPRLIMPLRERLGGQSNVEVVQGDVMQADLPALLAPLGPLHVVANLPYYLTTPILTRLLQLPVPIQSISVTIQQEAAQRLLAQPSTPSYGALALLAQYRSRVQIKKELPRRYFTPPPKVDSVFVTLTMLLKPPVTPRDPGLMFRLIDAGFAMRRKTLVNNLMAAQGLSREAALGALSGCGLDSNIRGEALTLQDYACLADVLS